MLCLFLFISYRIEGDPVRFYKNDPNSKNPAKSSDLTGTIEPIYFSGICSTCPVYSTLLFSPFSFTISV